MAISAANIEPALSIPMETMPLNARDLKVGATMIAGGGLGALLGWSLFAENYNIIACGVIGGAIGQFAAMWWTRRKPEK